MDEQFWQAMDGAGGGSKDGKINQKEFVTFVTDIWNPIASDRKALGDIFDKIKAPKSDVMTLNDITDALAEETIAEDFEELAEKYGFSNFQTQSRV